jgi:hypothetical protein
MFAQSESMPAPPILFGHVHVFFCFRTETFQPCMQELLHLIALVVVVPWQHAVALLRIQSTIVFTFVGHSSCSSFSQPTCVDVSQQEPAGVVVIL